MKTKLDLAHEWYIKHSEYPTFMDTEVKQAWDYADTMYEQLEKRENKGVPEVMSDACSDWQPDWSQSPEKATYWAMDADNSANFFKQKPEITNGNGWDFGGVMQSDRNHNYPYDWQNSLRKRPEGK